MFQQINALTSCLTFNIIQHLTFINLLLDIEII
jgi:hypothetical protein